MKTIPFQSIDTEYNGRLIERAALIIQGQFDDVVENVYYQIDTGAPMTHIFSGVFGDIKNGGLKTVYNGISLAVHPMLGMGEPYNQMQMNVVGILGMDFLTQWNGSFGFNFNDNTIIFECDSRSWLDYQIVGGHIYLSDVVVNGELVKNVMYDSGCSAFTIVLDCDYPPEIFLEKMSIPGAFGVMTDVYLQKGECRITIGDVGIEFSNIYFSSNKYDGMRVAMMGNALLDKRTIFFRKDGKYTII